MTGGSISEYQAKIRELEARLNDQMRYVGTSTNEARLKRENAELLILNQNQMTTVSRALADKDDVQYQLSLRDSEIKTLRANANGHKLQMRHAEAKITDARSGNEQLVAAINEKDATIQGQYAQIRELNLKVTELYNGTQILKSEVETLENTINGQRRYVHQLNAERTDLGNQIDELNGQIGLMRRGNDQLAGMRRKLIDLVLNLGYSVTDNMMTGDVKITGGPNATDYRTVRELHEINDGLHVQIKELKAANTFLHEENDGFARRHQEMGVKVDRLSTAAETLIQGRKFLIGERNELREKVKRLDAELSKRTVLSDGYRLRAERAEAKVGPQYDFISEYNAKIKELETQLAQRKDTSDGYWSRYEQAETRIKELEAALKERHVDMECAKELRYLRHQVNVERGKVKELIRDGNIYHARMQGEVTDLEEALAARIEEVKMVRGFRKKERDEKVEALEAEIKILKQQRQDRKNQLFAVVYGSKSVPAEVDFDITQLRGQIRELDRQNASQRVAMKRFESQIAYWKATAEKRGEAIKLLQELDLRKALRDNYEQAIRNFTDWLASKTGGDGYMGCNGFGKLDWCRRNLTQRFR